MKYFSGWTVSEFVFLVTALTAAFFAGRWSRSDVSSKDKKIIERPIIEKSSQIARQQPDDNEEPSITQQPPPAFIFQGRYPAEGPIRLEETRGNQVEAAAGIHRELKLEAQAEQPATEKESQPVQPEVSAMNQERRGKTSAESAGHQESEPSMSTGGFVATCGDQQVQVEIPLRETATGLEAKSIQYSADPLSDCSGIIFRGHYPAEGPIRLKETQVNQVETAVEIQRELKSEAQAEQLAPEKASQPPQPEVSAENQDKKEESAESAARQESEEAVHAVQPSISARTPYVATCEGQQVQVEIPLREIVAALEAKSIQYGAGPLSDCSGIFHRVLQAMKQRCPEHSYPPVEGYRDSRGIARWYYEHGRLMLIEDILNHTDLIKPGVVFFYGQAGWMYAKPAIKDLLTPRVGIDHVGIVVNVRKDASGNVTSYGLFHGHGGKGNTAASVTYWHLRTPIRPGYPPFGNGRQQLVAAAYLLTSAKQVALTQ